MPLEESELMLLKLINANTEKVATEIQLQRGDLQHYKEAVDKKMQALDKTQTYHKVYFSGIVVALGVIAWVIELIPKWIK